MQIIHDDVHTIFSRALVGKQLYAFGADGFGKYGRHEFAQYYKVKSVQVYLGTDAAQFRTTVTILLENYDASVFGHIYTDQNFWRSLTTILEDDWHIPPNSIKWAELKDQGVTYVSIDVDHEKVLHW
jgi:hypothetical protein